MAKSRIYFKIEDCEIYESSECRIFIGPSTKESSIGFLELNPRKKLSRHSRPVDEELVQIEGISTMTLFSSHSVEEITLKKGDYLKIPANKPHIHENRSSGKSLTLWKFEGDITEVIEKIISASKKIGD